MEPQEVIPKRSNFWFISKSQIHFQIPLFDHITIVLVVGLALFSFVIFWPLISQLNFEEAFFTPLVPFLMVILTGLFGIGTNEALRILFITSFVASTVGVYLLVRDLTKRQVTPILAALIYIIPPVPIFVLTFLRRGLYQAELSSAKSFLTIVYGDGAHFLALALVPLAVLFLFRYLKQAKGSDFAGATLLVSLILLANRSQGFSLFLVLTVILLTEVFLGEVREKIKRFFLVTIFSLSLVSFWYTPAFWRESFFIFNRNVVQNFKFFFPLSFTISLLSLIFSFVFFAKREDRQPIFVSFLLLIVFSIIVGGWLLAGHSFWPHPYRFFPNLNMFGAIVFALGLTAAVDKLRLIERFNFEFWSPTLKVWGALFFGLGSFVMLAVIAFFLSPIAVMLVSGPLGIWPRMRQSVLAERQETLQAAGGHFQLVSAGADNLQLTLGIFLTLVFLGVLVFLLIQELMIERKTN